MDDFRSVARKWFLPRVHFRVGVPDPQWQLYKHVAVWSFVPQDGNTLVRKVKMSLISDDDFLNEESIIILVDTLDGLHIQLAKRYFVDQLMEALFPRNFRKYIESKCTVAEAAICDQGLAMIFKRVLVYIVDEWAIHLGKYKPRATDDRSAAAGTDHAPGIGHSSPGASLDASSVPQPVDGTMVAATGEALNVDSHMKKKSHHHRARVLRHSFSDRTFSVCSHAKYVVAVAILSTPMLCSHFCWL